MTRLYLWAGSVAAVLALLAGVWLHGRSAGTSAAEAERNRAYRETIERVKDADLSLGDPDADLGWLLERAGKR